MADRTPTAEAENGAGASATRERVLCEASELFALNGYLGTSTRAIAEAAQIAQSTLFHHFHSKADIMDELLLHALEEPTAVAEKLAGGDGPAADRLRELLRFDIAFIFSSPYNLAGLSRLGVLDLEEFAAPRLLYDQLLAARRRMIEEGIAAGEFRAEEVDLLDDVVGAVVLGTAASKERRSRDPQRSAERYADLAIAALRRTGNP